MPPHPPGYSAAASKQEQQAREPSPSGASEFDSFDHPSSFNLPSSLSTSDLEFGADAFSGSTLETPNQLAHEYRHPHQQAQQGGGEHERNVRMQQADIAREAAEALEAAQGIARLVLEKLHEEQGQAGGGEPRGLDPAARADMEASESTAMEREERYQGIMQALDSLGAHETRGASDNEDERQSPEARRLLASTENQDPEFDALRHTVDELGEGEEAAELIMKSYQGRDLEVEALSTLDPADQMPHPGDRYLRPPNASPPSHPPPGGMEARLNTAHRPVQPPAHGPTSTQGQLHSRCLGGASGGDHSRHSVPSGLPAWMPPGEAPTAARAQHEPVEGFKGETDNTAQQAQRAQQAAEVESDDHIGLGGPGPGWAGVVGAAGAGGSGEGTADDQIDYEQDALRGADALYYAPEHDANPAVNGFGGGQAGASGNVEAPEAYDVDGDALRGGDAMFYFSAAPRGFGRWRGSEGQEHGEGDVQEGAVWGALMSLDDQHSGFRRAMEEAAAVASGHRHRHPSKPKATQAGRRCKTKPAAAPMPGQARSTGQAAAAALSMGVQGTVGGFSSLGWHSAAEPVAQAGVLAAVRRQEEARKESEQSVQQEVGRLRNGREPREPKPKPPTSSLNRVVEVAAGRSAALGLGSAVVTEILTRQSVVSQLFGRFEGMRQIEYPLNFSQSLASAVVVATVLVTVAEYTASRGTSPNWRFLGLSPSAQLWLGRAAMALFAALLTWESIHSNRPAFGTLFYLWF